MQNVFMKLKLTEPLIDKAYRERTKGVRTTLRDLKCPGLTLVIHDEAASWVQEYRPRGRRPDGRQFGPRKSPKR